MSRNAKSVQFVFAMFTNLLCKCSACYSRCWDTQEHVCFFIECSCMPACVHACLRLCSSGCKRKNRNAHNNTRNIAPMRDAILCGMTQSAVIFRSCVATWSCLHFQVLFITSIPALATCCSMPNDDEEWSWLDASFALRSSFILWSFLYMHCISFLPHAFLLCNLAIWSSFAFAYVLFDVHLCADFILALHDACRHAMYLTEWLLEYVLAT